MTATPMVVRGGGTHVMVMLRSPPVVFRAPGCGKSGRTGNVRYSQTRSHVGTHLQQCICNGRGLTNRRCGCVDRLGAH